MVNLQASQAYSSGSAAAKLRLVTFIVFVKECAVMSTWNMMITIIVTTIQCILQESVSLSFDPKWMMILHELTARVQQDWECVCLWVSRLVMGVL